MAARKPNTQRGSRAGKPSPSKAASSRTARRPPGKPRVPTGGKTPGAKTAARQKTAVPAGQQRLQKVLAAAGLGSRRQCEEYISEGRVEVNGEVMDRLGSTVDPQHDKIYVDGTRLQMPKPVYFVLHKPAGVVTTNRDPLGRTRVIDLIPPEHRVFPVGRLDRNSEGLILLTNDGTLADQLTHPRYGVIKVYHVTVAGQVNAEAMRKMREGIFIAEGRVSVEGAKIRKARAKATDMEITLREGKNREIRRILARLGHKVQKLRRIAIGPLRLGQMPTGAYRQLTFEEIKKLKSEAEAGIQRAGETSRPRKASSSKASANKKSAGKKPSLRSKPALPGKPAASRRTTKAAPEFHFDLKSSEPRAGAVIGAEPKPEKPKPKPKSKTTTNAKPKRASGKRAGKSPSGRPTRSTKKKKGR